MDQEPIAWPDDAPDLLSVMREVIIGRAPRTPLGRSLTAWLNEKPIPFSEKFMDLEAKYWASRSGVAVQGTWDGLGSCPVCKRGPEAKITSEAALVEAKDWLEKNR